jgi:3',5'-cyclic AMP phosphodiesterase CpdA
MQVLQSDGRAPRADRRGSVRVAVISDIHISHATPNAPESADALLRAMDEIRAAEPAAILAPGDLTESGRPDEIERALEVLSGAGVPVLCAPGNHDVGDKTLSGQVGVTAERLRSYEAVAGPARYAAHVAGLRVIALNASVLGSALPVEHEDWEWLDAMAPAEAGEAAMMMLHYPPFLDRADEAAGTYWTLEETPRARLLRLADRLGIRLILSGHLHRPIRGEWNGIRMLTAPSIAFGLPVETQPIGWMLIEIEADASIRSELRYVAGPGITSERELPSGRSDLPN